MLKRYLWRSEHEAKRLDRQLAQGQLSGPEKDRILEQVLARSSVPGSARSRPMAPRWAWLTAATAVLLAPVVWSLRGSDATSTETFRARGSGLPPGPVVDVMCTKACTRGEKLVFSVEQLDEEAFLAAYGQAGDGSRVWYFPSDDGALPSAGPSRTASVLDQGVRIGSEHPPGAYRVQMMLLRRRLTRAEIDQLAQPEATADLIMRRSQRIEVRP